MADAQSRLRIAIIGAVHRSALEGVRDLPGNARISTWNDIYSDFDLIREFNPQVVVLDGQAMRDGDLGVLRLLHRPESPELIIVFAVPRDRELMFSALAERAQARVLPTPCALRDVAVTLGAIATAPDFEQNGSGRSLAASRPSQATFFDIARGVADEINNPILFVAGHLQLLESSIDADREPDRAAQCRAIRQGLDRIAATMDKMKRLGAIRELEPPFGHTIFGNLYQRFLAERVLPPPLTIEVAPEVLNLAVRGSSAIWTEAFEHFLNVLVDLAGTAEQAVLKFSTMDHDLRATASLVGSRFAMWDGPRSFEPYYLNRILRGSPHGLALFLVQTIVSAHGGRAVATRHQAHEIRLELHLKCR